MTKENAIQELIDFKGAYTEYISNDALDMAIKALEQEPCEDKIIEWKKDFKEYVNSLSMPRDDYKGIMEYINDVPSVQPKYKADEWCKTCKEYDQDKHCCPRYNGVIRKAVEEIKQPKIKVGHWIHTGGHNYHCSECDFIQHESMSEYKYCPNCGAKIVEPQEGENKE